MQQASDADTVQCERDVFASEVDRQLEVMVAQRDRLTLEKVMLAVELAGAAAFGRTNLVGMAGPAETVQCGSVVT